MINKYLKLYHATYLPYLSSILKYGLFCSSPESNWYNYKEDAIYLATDENIAISFAETSELAPEEYLDKIVLLEIDTSGLDLDYLFVDSNIIFNDDEEIYSFEYHKDIDPQFIKVINY